MVNEITSEDMKSPHYTAEDAYICVHKEDFDKQRDLIQREICGILNGVVGDTTLRNICEVVVQRFDILEGNPIDEQSICT